MGIVPLHKTPSRSEAEAIINDLVLSGSISWSNHCKERMNERGITIQQVLNCLAKGNVTDEPFLAHRSNGSGYETAVERGTAGEYLRVAVCIKLSQRLLIITVY